MLNIFVAGHNGMVGSAIVRKLSQRAGEFNVVTRERCELNLLDKTQVRELFQEGNIDEVVLAAAKVGGIVANNAFPAEFLYENLTIQNNVIHEAHAANIQKLLFLGSSCIYPKLAEQPITEESLLQGKLEPTNEPYAIAKIAGIKMCESYNRQYGRDYRSVMPTNLYGQNDNFHPQNSHVIPGLMRRIHEAKMSGSSEIVVWGSGAPKREFMHVQDMADACIFIMGLSTEKYQSETDDMLSHVNVGTGIDCTINSLVEMLCDVIGYKGKIVFDTTKPDGTPRKLLNVSKIQNLGWTANIGLEDGLKDTYKWFLKNQECFRD